MPSTLLLLLPREVQDQAKYLTDEEASVLYDMWKGATPGKTRLRPPPNRLRAIQSLKAKGFVWGIGDLELTDRGKKVIVEMATREPNALDNKGAMPSYSEIKRANGRPRQTFTRRSTRTAGAGQRVFNLRRQRERMERDAGVWDWLTSPARDWAAEQLYGVKNWWGDTSAKIGGESFNHLRAVQRQTPIAQRELEQLYARTLSGGGVSPQSMENAIRQLKAAMQRFYSLTSRVVGLPPIPEASDPKYQSRTVGGVDQQGFMAYYNDLSRAVASVNENTALDYEKNKEIVTKAPQVMPGPEDKYLGKSIARLLRNVNRLTGRDIIPPQVMQDVSEGRVGDLNFIEKINKDVQSVSEQGDIDNVAADLIGVLFDDVVDQRLQHFLNSLEQRDRSRMYPMIAAVRDNLEKYIVQIMNEKYKRLYEYRGQAIPQSQSQPAPRPGVA